MWGAFFDLSDLFEAAVLPQLQPLLVARPGSECYNSFSLPLRDPPPADPPAVVLVVLLVVVVLLVLAAVVTVCCAGGSSAVELRLVDDPLPPERCGLFGAEVADADDAAPAVAAAVAAPVDEEES